MKKILFVCAIAALTFSSCGSKSNAQDSKTSAEVKTETKAGCCPQEAETATTATKATKADSSCASSCDAKKSCCD